MKKIVILIVLLIVCSNAYENAYANKSNFKCFDRENKTEINGVVFSNCSGKLDYEMIHIFNMQDISFITINKDLNNIVGIFKNGSGFSLFTEHFGLTKYCSYFEKDEFGVNMVEKNYDYTYCKDVIREFYKLMKFKKY